VVKLHVFGARVCCLNSGSIMFGLLECKIHDIQKKLGFVYINEEDTLKEIIGKSRF
jgi:hypothetical protein